MTITPVNGHLLIEPLKNESFMASQRETYEEVGVVVALAEELGIKPVCGIGDRVFFDSYLAAKYPKNEKEDFWLVRWEDVRAIEHAEEVSE
jgi:co-chaperonin GroES (HSP10)